MELIKDYMYEFEGLWEAPGECRIRIYKENHAPTVVICSESPNNHGGSITTMVEVLANKILRSEGEPRPFIWIEHDLRNVTGTGEATFDKVTFVETPEGKFYTPHWDTTTREEVERLVDQSI